MIIKLLIMSRSVKKTPIYKAIYNGSKKMANKRVRQYFKKIVDGNWFKKITNPYKIIDQCSYITKDDPYYEKVKRK